MSSSSTETPVDYLRDKGEAHTMTTYCPAGAFALAGGWEGWGADVLMTESYPSQLPGAGAGAWTLTVRKLAKRPALVVPYVTCLSGVSQAPE